MGLIKAGLGSLNGTLADQWKEFFYCDSISKDTLVVKGHKQTNSRTSNTKGNDNIISNGSGVAVNNGQCMIIVEQGKVVEYCDEPGEYTYNTSTEPSIFCGSLGEGIRNTFKTIGKRFTFGGDTAKDQRIYFFNIKEIIDNKFGTATPIPFHIYDKTINLDLETTVRCNGVYSYKLTNPILFYTNVCGNVADEYSKEEIDNQLKTEFLTALQPAFSAISELGVRPSNLPGHAKELSELMNKELTDKWSEIRGISIVSVGINSISIPEEDTQMMKELQREAALTNPNLAAGTMARATADAMKTAAGNPNGAMMGFMGMGLAQNNIANVQGMYAMANQSSQQSGGNGWTCSCGALNTGNFCIQCGTKKPESNTWTCSCGSVNAGNFCTNCGAKKPTAQASYKCNNCGFVPEDPQNPPKFCPQCGDPFNENDKA